MTVYILGAQPRHCLDMVMVIAWLLPDHRCTPPRWLRRDALGSDSQRLKSSLRPSLANPHLINVYSDM